MPVTTVNDAKNQPWEGQSRVLPGDAGEHPFAKFDSMTGAQKRGDIDRVTQSLHAAMSAPQTLTHERGKTHGDFHDHANVTQLLKDAMRNFIRLDGTRPWDGLSAIQKESLDMNAHKIGRILAGNPSFKDHWADMAGYSQLVADRTPD